jgi:hypothetical protein
MKSKPKKKEFTFGAFIASVWDACDQRKARRVVRHAVNTRLVVFRRHRRFVVS